MRKTTLSFVFLFSYSLILFDIIHFSMEWEPANKNHLITTSQLVECTKQECQTKNYDYEAAINLKYRMDPCTYGKTNGECYKYMGNFDVYESYQICKYTDSLQVKLNHHYGYRTNKYIIRTNAINDSCECGVLNCNNNNVSYNWDNVLYYNIYKQKEVLTTENFNIRAAIKLLCVMLFPIWYWFVLDKTNKKSIVSIKSEEQKEDDQDEVETIEKIYELVNSYNPDITYGDFLEFIDGDKIKSESN